MNLSRLRNPWRSEAHHWVGPIVVAATGVMMLLWSWAKWTDMMVDFGRELYIPWRLVEGESLYKDVAYFHGPLSPYLNSLVFLVFGTSLRTLVITNLGITAGFATMLYISMSRLAGRFAATVGGVVYLTTFAFAHPIDYGNFNFITPYSHEMTHGLALSFLALLLLWSHHDRDSWWKLAGAGWLLGIVFLTKPEFVLASAPAAVTGLLVSGWTKGRAVSGSLRECLVLLGAAAVPVIVAVSALAGSLPLASAIRGVLGSWPDLLRPELRQQSYYQTIMGTADIADSVSRILEWTGRYALILVPAALAAALMRLPAKLRWLWACLAAVVLVGPVIIFRKQIFWSDVARPFPLLLAVGASYLVMRILRRRRDSDIEPLLVPALSMTIFSGLLLAKMILKVQVYHYGFVLALPATMWVVMVLVSVLPKMLDKRGGNGLMFQTVSLALIAVIVGAYLDSSAEVYRSKTVWVGDGGDAFLADERGRVLQRLLDLVSERVAPGQTLAVIPEGVMVNYLSRRANPTPYINFMPPELIVFGEDRIVDAYRSSPPDFVVVTNRGASDYGYRLLGHDYGQEIGQWLEESYCLVMQIDDPELGKEEFAILMLLERKF